MPLESGCAFGIDCAVGHAGDGRRGQAIESKRGRGPRLRAGRARFQHAEQHSGSRVQGDQDGPDALHAARRDPRTSPGGGRRSTRSNTGLPTEAGQVVISNGAKHSIHNALMAVCGPGDEVIIPAPYWVSYSDLVKLTGATPVVITTTEEAEFKLTPEQFLAAVTPRTKLLMINSPSNPTGVVYDRAELAALADARAGDRRRRSFRRDLRAVDLWRRPADVFRRRSGRGSRTGRSRSRESARLTR